MMKLTDHLPAGLRKMLPPFVLEKIPFLMSGAVSTAISMGVYLLLVDRVLPPGPATIVAYGSSVIVNFFLQRYFVFELRRSVRSAFALSMMVSAGGMGLDWLIVTGLHRFPLLGAREWAIKLTAQVITFFYNFYAKRRVFEGKKGARPRDAGNAEEQSRAPQATNKTESNRPPEDSEEVEPF